jgi:hypothetical protein
MKRAGKSFVNEMRLSEALSKSSRCVPGATYSWGFDSDANLTQVSSSLEKYMCLAILDILHSTR